MISKQLSIEKRAKAITLLEEGYSLRQVAAKIGNNVHHSTISRLRKKYLETHKLENKPIPGHPPKLTPCEEHIIIRKILKGECKTAVDVYKSLKLYEKINISPNTIRRVLKKNGFKAYT